MSKATNRRSSNGAKGAVILLMVAVIVFFIAFYFFNPNDYTGQAEFTATGVNVSFARNAGSFYVTSNGFFMFNEDNVSFHSNTGEVLFNREVAMNNPSFSGTGTYAVVLEQGGRAAHVFNEQGEIYLATVNEPILNYSLSASGHLILITGNSNQCALSLFGTRGELILTDNLAHPNRIPIASDISSNGQRMAVVFLDFSGAEFNFIVFFYSIEGNTATIIGSNSYNYSQILGAVRFVNNHLITISDFEIRSYNESGTMVSSIPVDSYITHFSFTNNYFAIAFSESNPNTPGEHPGTVIFFDTNLNRLSVFESSNKITGLVTGHNVALITAGRELTAVAANGNTLWRRIITHDITHAAFLSSPHEIILVGNDLAQVFTIN